MARNPKCPIAVSLDYRSASDDNINLANSRRWSNSANLQETLADVDAIQQFSEAGVTYRSRFRAFS